jgi:F-type H+-transporting ATPase subunit delta
MQSPVSKRYARALFELAREENFLDRVEKDLSDLYRYLKESDEFRNLLVSPVIHATRKRKILEDLFGKQFNKKTLDFLRLLLDKNREALLPEMIGYFQQLLDEKNGIIRGQLQTAYPLNEQQLDLLNKRLNRITGKNVVITQQVDKELLGGFVVRMQDTVIDSSLKNQLLRLRENLLSPENG